MTQKQQFINLIVSLLPISTTALIRLDIFQKDRDSKRFVVRLINKGAKNQLVPGKFFLQ